jgi:integrase
MARMSSRTTKPKKPYPTFPLTPHPNGQWCKKVRGQLRFFGVWADPDAALANYNRQASDLHAGREPQAGRLEDVPTVKNLANAFLASKKAKYESGTLTARWFDDCLVITKAFVAAVGKTRRWDDLAPGDFGRYRQRLYRSYGVHAIDRHMTAVRSMFKFAYDSGIIDRPVRYGQEFDKPSAKEKRQSRAARDREHGKRLFSLADLLNLLKHAEGQLKAMILLGINAGFGNTDCAQLPIAAVDLKNAVIDYERPKTAVQRVAPLWPETAAALLAVLGGDRPAPKQPEYAGLVFLTRFGNPWKLESVGQKKSGEFHGNRQDAVCAEFNKLLDALTLYRKGVGFYALRHTFRTWADETKDQHAIHRIMGHAIPGMSGAYVEEISMERLKAVTDAVRRKLYLDPTSAQ